MPGRIGNSCSKYRSTGSSPVRSTVSWPCASTAPMRSPSTAMRTARSGTLQSTSNQRANGEDGPSRSTLHSAALSRTGVGTAMWLGTTSATASSPRSCSTSTIRSKAAPAAGVVVEPGVVDDVVPVLATRASPPGSATGRRA